jgi:hypothetical protein
MSPVVAKKLTPVLMVEAIEPCLPLWIDRLGWTKTAEVPHGDALGFVILTKDGIEVMYQSRASIAADLGEALAPKPGAGPSVGLYIEVSDVDEIEKQLAGLPLVVPRRHTFYGSDEVGVAEAGGHTVIFAQHGKDA